MTLFELKKIRVLMVSSRVINVCMCESLFETFYGFEKSSVYENSPRGIKQKHSRIKVCPYSFSELLYNCEESMLSNKLSEINLFEKF